MRRVPLPIALRRLPRARVRGDRLVSRGRAVLFLSTGRRRAARAVHPDGGTIMTRSLIPRGFYFALWLAASAAILAQNGSIYDPSAEITVTGTITHVVSFTAPDGSVGVHLDFRTPA